MVTGKATQEKRLTHYPRRFRECLIQIHHLPRYLSSDVSSDQRLVNVCLSWGSAARPRGGTESVGLGCAYATAGGLKAAACSQLLDSQFGCAEQCLQALQGPWQRLPSPGGTRPPSSICCLKVASLLLLLLSPEPLRKQEFSDRLLVLTCAGVSQVSLASKVKGKACLVSYKRLSKEASSGKKNKSNIV